MNYTNDNEFPGGSDNSRLTEAEFEKIIDEYKDLVERTITYNNCPRMDIDDAVQETFVKVWRNYKLHDPALSFVAWIKVIARREAINMRRKWRRTKSLDDFIESLIVDSDGSSFKNLEISERNRILRVAIESLESNELKKTIIMYYYEGKATSEIAWIMRCPKSTARGWLIKARNILGERLRKAL